MRLAAMRGVGGALLLIATAVQSANAAEHATAYPAPLSPQLPYDVDVAALRRLDRFEQIPEAQRLFDIFAWRAFVALSWPARADGSPDTSKSLADATSPRVWMGWRGNDTVFLPDGSKPEPWNAAAALRANAVPTLWRHTKMLDESRTASAELSDSMQAFTGPLVDQNGVFVRYESLINEAQFKYLFDNALYNQEGQIDFVATRGKPIEFPANRVAPAPQHGSYGIKLAWKQLGERDIASRYFTREAIVVSTSFDDKGRMVKTRSRQLMGLVGMHVTALTQSAPNWIWATFEHVDNVVANDLETAADRKGAMRRVRPAFNNPDQPTKPVNVLPPMNAAPDASGKFTNWDEKKTTNPTQLTRLVPIPPATQELNRQVQALLRGIGSVFQHYELIGTQWPVQPGFPAFGGGAGSAPESILYKVPGRVVPVYLVNTTMESYFQTGTQPAGPLEEDDRLPVGFFADAPTERVTPDRTLVFGTESCVGCHFSAGAAVAFKRDQNGALVRDPKGAKVPVYGKNASFGQTGNAHYFWQLQLKARSRERLAATGSPQ